MGCDVCQRDSAPADVGTPHVLPKVVTTNHPLHAKAAAQAIWLAVALGWLAEPRPPLGVGSARHTHAGRRI